MLPRQRKRGNFPVRSLSQLPQVTHRANFCSRRRRRPGCYNKSSVTEFTHRHPAWPRSWPPFWGCTRWMWSEPPSWPNTGCSSCSNPCSAGCAEKRQMGQKCSNANILITVTHDTSRSRFRYVTDSLPQHTLSLSIPLSLPTSKEDIS